MGWEWIALLVWGLFCTLVLPPVLFAIVAHLAGESLKELLFPRPHDGV
jgi:hypothetical protein